MAMQEEWPGEEQPWADWAASEADPPSALKDEAEDSELQGLEEPSAVEDEEVDFGDAAEVFDPEAKPEDVQEKFRDAFRKMGYTILLSGLCDMSLVDYVSWPSFFEDMASSILQACSRFGEVLHCFPDCGGVHARVWVRFATEQAAEACQNKMDGATFAGNTIKVEMVENDHPHQNLAIC
ncbi:unnamed protein product [Symbiodinium necroappetens]|uniref:RRM domain-containing protein n=1 Tax=Symbiodinium necroappetens TaxID=1628268 RepID=A0A813CKF6_9DINO|nr:unnamed protein product [Symbiodinium necroappetens]